MTKISGFSTVIEKTPTIGSSTTFSSGDQVGGIQTLTSAAIRDAGLCILQGLTVVEGGDTQMGEFDIFFFDASPTIDSSDNEAVSMSTANMVDDCIGRINCPAAYWKSMAAGQVYGLENVGATFKAASGDIYALVVNKGTPNLAGDPLKFVYTFSQDLPG